MQVRARATYAGLRASAAEDKALASTAGQADEARRTTILGVSRDRLLAAVKGEAAPRVRKNTLRFRGATERKRAANVATNCWSGRATGALSRRLGGALAAEAAAGGAVTMAKRARQHRLRLFVCAVLRRPPQGSQVAPEAARHAVRCFDARTLVGGRPGRPATASSV